MLRCLVLTSCLLGVLMMPVESSATSVHRAEVGVSALPAVPDTNQVLDDHSPRGALWRSAVLPGWGQWYNGQFYKIPVIYLGLGGLVTATVGMHDSYITHRRALLYDFDNEQYAEFSGEWERLREFFDQGRDDLVRERRDAMRRNRDLFILITGVWYALATIEAYVSAQLLDFDVDEDLSLSVHPSLEGITARLRIGL